MMSVLCFFSIITSIKNNSDKVQLDLSRLPSFEKILVALEGQLLEGRIFQVMIYSSFNSHQYHFSHRIVLNKSLIEH